MSICEPLCQFSTRLFFTTFPSPTPSASQINRLGQRAPQIRSPSRSTSPENIAPLYYYFTVDDDLTYLSFFEDWGPLNIAMIYRACIYIHELLEDVTLREHRLVLYSSSDSRRKANAALIMALYVLIVLHRPPWEAFQPISELEFMPFRDAGRGKSDFNLNIHDCLWGFWKAQQNNLIDMNDFSLQEYEFYEKVENGDWNWITPRFIAFASPSDTVWIRQQREKATSVESPSKLSTTSFRRRLPQPFQNCLDHFEERGVKLVIRLNNPLYDRGMFEERGIEHLELYFDDGTNPTDKIVREFIARSEAVFEDGGAVAIHCKAGLGRTGTLIGAYLIYKYGFTANEAIAFMRICRPGCVVGPQQQYLYQRQMDWVRWAAIDQAKQEQERDTLAVVTSASIPRPVTPPMEDVPTPTTPLRQLASCMTSAVEVDAMLPPGQPRKTPTGKRVALDMLGDDDEFEDVDIDNTMGDVNMTSGGRGAAPVTKQSRTLSPSGQTAMKTATAVAGSPAKQSRAVALRGSPMPTGKPVRVSSRIQDLANARRTGSESAAVIPQAGKKHTAPSQITRRAREEPVSMRLRSGTQPQQSQRTSRPAPSKIPSRKFSRPGSPPTLPSSGKITPSIVASSGSRSRLPTLIPIKRTFVGSSLSMTTAAPTMPSEGLATGSEGNLASLNRRTSAPRENKKMKEDAWMSGADAMAAVEPGTKSGSRPSIQRVRRRRSSFSTIDINV